MKICSSMTGYFVAENCVYPWRHKVFIFWFNCFK